MIAARTRGWIEGIAVVSLVLAAGATPAGAAPGRTSHAVTQTQVRIVSLFDGRGNLNPGGRMLSYASGTCGSGSIADARSDAWRCFAGNFIMDPCFADQSGRFPLLLCLPAPWADQAVLFRLTARLQQQFANHGKPGGPLPWGLLLSDGERCTPITGATTTLGSLRLSYGCAPQASLYGEVNRAHQPWTVLLWKGPGLEAQRVSQLKRVAVQVAWY